MALTNVAHVASVGSRRVLGAAQGPFGLALAVVDEAQKDALGEASAGYVGVSDGWQDFHRNGALTWRYGTAGPGNVALTAAIPRRCVIALGFGSSVQSAATLAITALAQPFDGILRRQIQEWTQWHSERNEHSLFNPGAAGPLTHQFSLSFDGPEGASRQDLSRNDRRQPERALGATAAMTEAATTWSGHAISSNAPSPFWGSAPGERRATPFATLSRAKRPTGAGARTSGLAAHHIGTASNSTRPPFRSYSPPLWPSTMPWTALQPVDMVTRALSFIARTGPSTGQDRWEENAGLNPFTLAIAIGALGRRLILRS